MFNKANVGVDNIIGILQNVACTSSFPNIRDIFNMAQSDDSNFVESASVRKIYTLEIQKFMRDRIEEILTRHNANAWGDHRNAGKSKVKKTSMISEIKETCDEEMPTAFFSKLDKGIASPSSIDSFVNFVVDQGYDKNFKIEVWKKIEEQRKQSPVTSKAKETAIVGDDDGMWKNGGYVWALKPLTHEVVDEQFASFSLDATQQPAATTSLGILTEIFITKVHDFESGFTVAFKTIEVVVHVDSAEYHADLEFNAEYDEPQNCGDASFKTVGTKYARFLRLTANGLSLDGQYATTSQEFFSVKPHQQRIELESKMTVSIAETNITCDEGVDLPSHQKQVIIERMMSKEKLPEHDGFGKVCLHSSVYQIEAVERKSSK